MKKMFFLILVVLCATRISASSTDTIMFHIEGRVYFLKYISSSDIEENNRDIFEMISTTKYQKLISFNLDSIDMRIPPAIKNNAIKFPYQRFEIKGIENFGYKYYFSSFLKAEKKNFAQFKPKEGSLFVVPGYGEKKIAWEVILSLVVAFALGVIATLSFCGLLESNTLDEEIDMLINVLINAIMGGVVGYILFLGNFQEESLPILIIIGMFMSGLIAYFCSGMMCSFVIFIIDIILFAIISFVVFSSWIIVGIVVALFFLGALLTILPIWLRRIKEDKKMKEEIANI